MNVEMWPIENVRPYENNPRINDRAINVVVESIKRFGFRQPIVVDKSGVIVVGHSRYFASLKMQLKSVPVHVAADLTPDQIRTYRIADNKTNERSEWDMGLLKVEIGEMPDTELKDIGFDPRELKKLLDNGDDEQAAQRVDSADELRKKWKTERGQLWQLGQHRILCGDSTLEEDVRRLMGDDSASICWTDPPWNVAYGSSDHPSYRKRSIENDNLGDGFGDFAHQFCKRICEVLVPGGILYMAMSSQEWGLIMQMLQASGFQWSSTIIWKKDRLVMSRKDYHTCYEPIWYGWKRGAPSVFSVSDRGQSDVWDIPRPSRSEDHPTMKPVELVSRSLRNSSQFGSVVYDPFSGSGTTIVACENLGRKCRAIEISPGYVAVAIQRWMDTTGKEPKLS